MGTRILRLPEYNSEEPPDPSDLPTHIPELESDQHILVVFANQPNALQFPLTDQAILGRRSQEIANRPDIDLAPFGAFPAGISRRHCLLRREAQELLLMDLGSSNGTRLGERRLEPHMPVAINTGDMLWLGKLQAWIYFSF